MSITIKRSRKTAGGEWDRFIELYNGGFPPNEREPVDKIAERVQSGRYVFAVITHQGTGEQIGFYILDIFSTQFALFSYIAIDPAHQGKGYGAEACKRVMSTFRRVRYSDLLYIEGHERQAAFYNRLGFLRVPIEYLAPDYDGSGSSEMTLLVFPQDKTQSELSAEELKTFIKRLFIEGYYLEPDDPRIAAQLAKVGPQPTVPLLAG